MAEKRSEGAFFSYGAGKDYFDSLLSGERLSNNLKSLARTIAGRKFKQLDSQDRDIKSAKAKRVAKDAIAEAKKRDNEKGKPSTAADRRGSNATLKSKPKTESSSPKPKTESTKKEPTSIAEAKRMGKSYFIGRDGKRKAAVTKEELDASGMSLNEYLNKQQGKTPAKKAKGGVAAKKNAFAKGGMANCGASVPPNRKAKS